MELKKVGYCYASFNQLHNKLKNYYELENIENESFHTFKVETDKGINFKLIYKNKKYIFNCNKKIYFSIFGYNAAALKKFELHTNITALSVREYNEIKGGAPYQVFKSEV
tara:strand:+ start:1171 stop:1500 length:330 start_codon:yes stop_codon:yes gene_type:complete